MRNDSLQVESDTTGNTLKTELVVGIVACSDDFSRVDSLPASGALWIGRHFDEFSSK